MTEPHDLTPPDGGALSHLDDRGRARMVDVSGKADTARVAVAAGELVTTAEVVSLVRADDMPKADVLATARIAGIAAAKRTWELIPLCHQLALSSVKVTFGFTDTAITIEATAKTKGPTGVEMEALTAVAVAGLTLHDMVKAVDPAAVLNGVRLVSKEGGKRGHWQRDEAESAAPAEDETVTPDEDDILEQAGVPATVLVASTGVAAGTREDRTGPLIADFLEARGFTVRGPLVYADADIAWGLEDALAGDPALVISTGGTGASPTDATPEATLALLDRELPGVAEAIRLRGLQATPHASLSRGVAGLVGRTVVVNLPGSPGGVKDGLAVLEPILGHLLAQVAGGGAHE
ncbi:MULTISPECIES: bifunctional molybdenum cofactor biosynthesis protein MoaC/MoaB [Rhodococcus]|uniref:bifunctional molybdenum cofactor biosynthesis protein MoaC/MoaB n=1 Tax=Rhodococcus TaxID=1827 RepID=UPI000C9A0D74|nr:MULTISPECIES: bifunctional molybdenum cofactor biosynthesis protein MoaC/MoaB [Rhodococcus]PND53707.1 bifunctional molybdenum cofactor biosynthesis protein MoaC/MoaB [Rhodococcus sp. ENV425]QRI73790.1 bifunctional molybdenum cofactor biosynthesis protein MoaC/MoaB [Rhodococcus aetherivorans]QSE57196.1 bifunctional molybdenum cofactor biosynthesis protein MoaC/MoaB [Rhodococcus sp. PSBB066]QSE71466.1 bifunctional molybdenum cofactor biosynthesis protein MoaC/MoaB [Rhodococcus sp. PSBB049]WKW